MAQSGAKSEKKNNFIAAGLKSTFRRHSGGEYAELLTRGIRGNRGVNKRRPWAYVRLFSLIFVLFAIYLLIVRFTSNELFIPTICVLAAIFVNIPFLLLIYELYPARDLSFMFVCLAMLVGGAAANIVSQILFNIFPVSDPWVNAVLTGIFEEIPKAAAAVMVIVISKKSSPLAGFVLGAAVGCGFSICEDMGYILMEANELPVVNLTTIIETAAVRGASALCTHTLWTAAVGWAYCHFTRHLANIAFYLITILSCGLHIAWDLPLGYSPLAMGFIYAGCAAVAVGECIAILHFERKKVFSTSTPLTGGANVQLSILNEISVKEDETMTDKRDPSYWKYWGRFTVALAAVLMAVVGVLYCSIPFRETYGTQTFSTPESFIEFMQDGKVFNAKENRPYNAHDTGGDERPSPGRVVQSETVDGVIYSYMYTENYDQVSGLNYYFPEAVYATVETDEGTFTYHKEDLYNDGKLYASFFRINKNVTGYIFSRTGNVTVVVYNPDYVRDLTEWRYLSLFCTFAAIFGVSIVCYVSLEIKSWRVKKQCLTENASSAE